jgi:hypothetical protein
MPISGVQQQLEGVPDACMFWPPLCRRLRKDVEESGGNPGAFDGLKDVRSLEYEVDTLGQKLKR